MPCLTQEASRRWLAQIRLPSKAAEHRRTPKRRRDSALILRLRWSCYLGDWPNREASWAVNLSFSSARKPISSIALATLLAAVGGRSDFA